MIHFYLRDKKSAQSTSILISVHYENNRIRIATGCTVPPKMWQEKKQRAKVSIEFQMANEINDRLDKLEAVMESLMKQYRDEGHFPNPARIKADFLKQHDVPIKHKKAKTFWDHFNDFVEVKRQVNPDVRDYNNSIRKHLLSVENRLGGKLSFALITSETSSFKQEWSNYLAFVALNSMGEPGLMPNTIGKQNKNLKAFLNWSFDQNITKKFSLKSFPTIMEDVDKVYLTEEELDKLEAILPKDPSQALVRDLFLVGCESGLRFSDFIRIQPHDIRKGHLHITPKKTKSSSQKQIIIPISARFERVLKKYEDVLPNFDRNALTRFNASIRDLCAKAQIDDKIVFSREVAGKTVLVKRFKYEEISSHTCRRTFCTLKFLKGMPSHAIMKFSGHKTERNFVKYLKLDAELTARTYGEYF